MFTGLSGRPGKYSPGGADCARELDRRLGR
jgi:hypothetical protein